jgi:Domain of unknown function (DUF1883)
MMTYLHQEFDAGPDDILEVTMNGHANVMLLDPGNYDHYRKGESYRYHGGLAKVSPVRLSPPSRGHWHAVVDLGGYAGTIRAGMQLLQGVNAAG